MTLLTDLEYRVWTQYLLSADDFGVMHATAVALQHDNLHLANRPKKMLTRCLDVLVKVGLVHRFEHQGQPYLFQADWQEWQKVEYPRATVNPIPTGAMTDVCDDGTRTLFLKHPGGQRKDRRRPENAPSDSARASQMSPEHAPSDSARPSHVHAESVPTTRAGPRETATAQATAQANGTRQTAPAENLSAVRAPLTGNGVFGAGALPRDHLRHAACGRVCLTDRQFGQFVGKFGGNREVAADKVRLWAAAVLAEWDQPPKLSQSIAGGDFQFWDARWEEWQGAALKSGSRLTADPATQNAEVAEILRKGALS